MTGGAGFIGSHLVSSLSHAGHAVRILDNFSGIGSKGRASTLSDLNNVQIIEGDIRVDSDCHAAVQGADYILHHAAEPSVARSVEDPATCADVNVGGTINMLTAASNTTGIRGFVFASSCAVYGDTAEDEKSESGPNDPLTPYATTKLAGEYFCRNFQQLRGVPTISLRYFNVYGPGQDPNGAYAAVIPKFLTAVANGKRPIIYGDGEQSRDFIFVDDIVRANLCAVESAGSVAGRTFNIGGGAHTSLNVLVQKLESILDREINPERVDRKNGDILHSRANISRAAEHLNFIPTVSLDDGLARTLHWYTVSTPS